MTRKPHDALFKVGFEAPEQAAVLFQMVLPPAIRDAIAWDSMVRVAGSFVDPALDDRHTDLLFSTTLHDHPALLIVLLEHQSTVDPNMALRMLGYMVRIWEQYQQEDDSSELPIILPIMVSHAPGGWTAPVTFHDMFSIELGSIPGLERLVPNFSIAHLDLNHADNDTLMRSALENVQKLILWVLRDARDTPTLLANLEHWFEVLLAVLSAQNGVEAAAQIFRYLSLVTERMTYEEIRDKVLERLPETEASMQTMGEWLIEQGREKGLAQGLEQGLERGLEQGLERGREQALQDILIMQLNQKFGALPSERRAAIDAASSSWLLVYIERVMAAPTLDAVFADVELA